MGRSINPLLLETAPATAIQRRNWARPAGTVDGTSFTQQLAATGAQSAQPVTPTAKTAAIEQTAKAATPAANTAASETAASDAADEETSGTADIKPASSWRVNRSAAEVNHEVNDFTLDDLVDVLNPLQHIPILSIYYRQETGDDIKPVPRVAGDILFGAVTGSLIVSGLISVATAAYEQQTGKEPVIQVADALFGSNKSNPDAATMLASADAPAAAEGAEIKLAEASEAPVSTPSPALAPAPVQVATLDENDVKKSAAPAVAAGIKQPYGGVMDTAAIALGKSRTAVASAANVSGLRIGDKIYTSPLMNQAARTAALQAAEKAKSQAAAVADAAAATAAAQTPLPQSKPVAALASAAAPSLSVPGSDPDGKNTLGQVMHQSAIVSETGRTLPPELVRDMMLMALDKYKTASGLAPSQMSLQSTN